MVTGTPSADMIMAYSTPIAPPPAISNSRGLRSLPAMVWGVKHARVIERHAGGPQRARPGRYDDPLGVQPGLRAIGGAGQDRVLAAHQVHAALADPLQCCLPELLADPAGPRRDSGYVTSGADRATPYTFSFSKPLR